MGRTPRRSSRSFRWRLDPAHQIIAHIEETFLATILHLLPAHDWDNLGHLAPVVNASLDDVGFIHCTDDHDVLLRVANAFYTEEPGKFVALLIDTERLLSPCVWEAPAHIRATDDELVPLFPHVYGVIDRQAILGAQDVQRDVSGRFIGFGEMRTDRA